MQIFMLLYLPKEPCVRTKKKKTKNIPSHINIYFQILLLTEHIHFRSHNLSAENEKEEKLCTVLPHIVSAETILF